MQPYANAVSDRLFSLKYFSFIAMVLCCSTLSSFSQVVDVISPVTKANYKLPDPATLQTAADVQAAITADEIAGKALANDAATEMAKSKTAEADLANATTMNNTYLTALTNFGKNDVAKYTADLNNYTADGTKFNVLLTSYNKAAQANNALPAKDRKAATVAALNKQKAQLDVWGLKLTQWKTRLDAAKAKLDVKKAALEKQKQQADAATLAATNKLKVVNGKLKSLSEQLVLCANYNDKCRGLLVSKFNSAAAPDTGFFSTPSYKGTIAGLTANLERLKHLPGVV